MNMILGHVVKWFTGGQHIIARWPSIKLITDSQHFAWSLQSYMYSNLTGQVVNGNTRSSADIYFVFWFLLLYLKWSLLWILKKSTQICLGRWSNVAQVGNTWSAADHLWTSDIAIPFSLVRRDLVSKYGNSVGPLDSKGGLGNKKNRMQSHVVIPLSLLCFSLLIIVNLWNTKAVNIAKWRTCIFLPQVFHYVWYW